MKLYLLEYMISNLLQNYIILGIVFYVQKLSFHSVELNLSMPYMCSLSIWLIRLVFQDVITE